MQLRQLTGGSRRPLLLPLSTSLKRLQLCGQLAVLLLQSRQHGTAPAGAAANGAAATQLSITRLLLHQQGLDGLQLSSGCLQRRLSAVPGPRQLGGLTPQALCLSRKLAAALPRLGQLESQLSTLLRRRPAAAGGAGIKLAGQAGTQRGQLSVLLLPPLQGRGVWGNDECDVVMADAECQFWQQRKCSSASLLLNSTSSHLAPALHPWAALTCTRPSTCRCSVAACSSSRRRCSLSAASWRSAPDSAPTASRLYFNEGWLDGEKAVRSSVIGACSRC